MEGNSTFDDALTSLVDYKPLGPVCFGPACRLLCAIDLYSIIITRTTMLLQAYIIVGGTKPAEGAVIAKEFNATAEEHGVLFSPASCHIR